MVKFKICKIGDDSKLNKLYELFNNCYSNKFKKYLGELKLYTTESDCEIIKSEHFKDLINENELEYTSLYFIFDSRVPFHILEKDDNKLIVVDEYFEDIDIKDSLLEIKEFDNVDECYSYINETYKEFLDNQFNILIKYYHEK